MSVFQLRSVHALRWIRDEGRDPIVDNAQEIIEFIGADRVLEDYRADLGDSEILFRTSASRIGIARLKAMDWVIIGPAGQPMAIDPHVFEALIFCEIED